LAGPNATIQNTPPLVTSNKARAKHNLAPLTNPDGSPARFDVLCAQRLAAPVTLYVEQFSAHPLEADAAELYGPPDGYIDSVGQVHRAQRTHAETARLAGFVIEGFYPLRQARSMARHRLMLRAVDSGLPVVRVGRGNTEGFVPLHDPCFIGGSNLTATKARLLLMGCLMKFGSLPPVADPHHPTSAKAAAVSEKITLYHAVFDTQRAVGGSPPTSRPLISTLPSSVSWRRRSFRSAMLSNRIRCR
jgi:hypothetical protein